MDDYRRYRKPKPSTRALTAKVAVLAVIATLLIGALIAAKMAAGNDPALGPKAAARAKKASTDSSSGGSSISSGTDPDGEGYGDDGYYYGSGSSGYPSGASGYSYSPPPVTSSTS